MYSTYRATKRCAFTKFLIGILCAFCGGMKQYLSTLLLTFLTQLAFPDIFRDLSYFNENEGPADIFENNTKTESNDMAHRLLDVLGKQLLSNDENSNILAQASSLADFKEKLDAILKPFSEQNSKLATEINHFKTNVLNKVRSLMNRSRTHWNRLKGLLPTLQIFCKQLIDRVTTIF